MEKIVCEMCGSNDLVKQSGKYVCQSCGTKYSVEEARKMMIEGTVDVSGSKVKIDNSKRIENLRLLAKRAVTDQEAARYYEEIAIADPNDWEACFYKVYYVCKQTNLANIGNCGYQLSQAVKTAFKMISYSQMSSTEKETAYRKVFRDSLSFVNLCTKSGEDYTASTTSITTARTYWAKQSPGLNNLRICLGDECMAVGLNDCAEKAYSSCSRNSLSPSEISHVDSQQKSINPSYTPPKACYVATAVYGSYDCPEVWTLRRYRDYNLAETWYGRLFIHTYYAISPTIVKWFGNKDWFKKMWKGRLDRMVRSLREKGYESTPYKDREW